MTDKDMFVDRMSGNAVNNIAPVTLEDCFEALQTQDDVLRSMSSILECYKATCTEERAVVETVCDYLKDDMELQKLKEETMESGPAAKKRKLNVNTEAELSKVHTLVEYYRAKAALFENLKTEVVQRSEAAAKDLVRAKLLRARKHAQLTQFARRYCSSEAQRLPAEMLTSIFSKLQANDLITIGQVCQRWRDISRQDESLWRSKTVTYIGHGELLRVLKAAPYLGNVYLSDSALKQVRGSKCKFLGFTVPHWTDQKIAVGVLNKHSAHLEALTLCRINSALATAVSGMRLTELNLTFNRSDQNSNLDISVKTLVKLKCAGHVHPRLVVSLLNSCSGSLKELDLFSDESDLPCPHLERTNEELIIRALLCCNSLRLLQIPFHYATYDLNSLTFKAEKVTLWIEKECKFHKNAIASLLPLMTSQESFAVGSVLHLKIVHHAREKDFEMILNFIKKVPRSTLKTVTSIVFKSKYFPRPDVSIALLTELSSIPELENKWRILSTHPSHPPSPFAHDNESDNDEDNNESIYNSGDSSDENITFSDDSSVGYNSDDNANDEALEDCCIM